MIDLQSILIYLGLPLLSFFIAKYAEQTNNKKVVWLIVILMSLVAGMRDISVGIDTKTYDGIFHLVSLDKTNQIYGVEESFKKICEVLLHIWNNNHFLFFVFALLTHGLIIFRLWQEKDHLFFRWSVISYYILIFPFSLNGLRQAVAVAIVFYATGLLKKGKYVKFSVAVLIASLFHSSAIIGIVYLFFEVIILKYFEAKRKIFIYLVLILGVTVGLSEVLNMVNSYSKYLERQATSVGIMMIVKIMFLLASFIIIKIPKGNKEEYYSSFHQRWVYLVGLLLNSLSYIFLYVGRIGLYFYVYEAIYIGCVFKEKNRTIWVVLFKCAYVFLMLYYLYNNISKGAQGEMPYRFFWQTRSIY